MTEKKTDSLFSSNDKNQAPLEFAQESGKKKLTAGSDVWKILVVDDEEDVHAATHLILDNLEFAGKKVKILDAHSSRETEKMFAEHNDICLVLLDVVMELTDSGLHLVKYIREQLNNKFVRIVLRTGQPGAAPERDVIVNYDINDYKTKTELTSEKLFTTVIASLRSYQSIMEVESYRVNLENKVKERTAKLQHLKDELEKVLELTV